MNAYGPAPTEAEAQSLLDFTRELDIKLLDAVVGTVMTPPNPRQVRIASGLEHRLLFLGLTLL